MPLPVGHAIIGASIVVASRTGPLDGRDWWAVLLGAALAVCPDFDIFPIWLFNLDGNSHRGLSHSILLAVALGPLASLLTRSAGGRRGMVYFLAALSHGLADTLVSKREVGVQLLWPLPYRFRLGLFDYFAPLIDPRYMSASAFVNRLFWVSLVEAVLFAPLLLAAVLISRAKSRAPAEV